MSASSSPDGWSRAQRWLHWTVAALVFTGFVVGLVMVALPLTQLLAKIIAYQVHKTIGLLVPPLVLWRLILRARRGRPAEDDGIPVWQRRAAGAGHAALYALLMVVPVLGYVTASTAPGQIPTTLFLLIPVPHLLPPDAAAYEALRAVHRTLAWTLVILALGHGGMAIVHHWRGRPTLRLMLGR
ncbi:cytochrome b/b6 domain-containing protein [Roseomonas sp. HJA6]|uniref:Cytochrome b/b6 domain-containing protein n=1 Tax=Roseomonas alba TaxID=2846776 RepID=A0ABS7ADU5_9PROT|nr:cytochrome b/b6 domain-containing protein [Neoroseomonas alba]